MTTTTKMIDVTLTYATDLPCWPGDPRPVVERIRDMDSGASNNVTRLDSHLHFATHVDAPIHFVKGGRDVAELSLDDLIGPSQVLHLPDAEAITADILEKANLDGDIERLLLRTRNSLLWDNPAHEFKRDYVALTPDAAQWVVDRGIRLIGVDYLSVERFKEPGHATHHILLEAEVVIVEGLDLRGVEPGAYTVYCLPMKIGGADGAPARVVLQTP